MMKVMCNVFNVNCVTTKTTRVMRVLCRDACVTVTADEQVLYYGMVNIMNVYSVNEVQTPVITVANHFLIQT